MSWARAAASSVLTFGTVARQSGRVPHFIFIRSSTSSAVVLGSTVADLSSGTGGGFTLAQSVVMSAASPGHADSVAIATASAAARHAGRMRWCMVLLPYRSQVRIVFPLPNDCLLRHIERRQYPLQ